LEHDSPKVKWPAASTIGDILKREGLVDAQQVVARLQLALVPIDVKGVKSADEFRSILSTIGEEPADALFIFPNFVNGKHGQASVDFATARGVNANLGIPPQGMGAK
jgi:hypothetical protein